MYEIKTADARVQIREDMGAAISRYDLDDGTPVFRPSPADASDEFQLACNLMIPWCNRISDGGFYADSVFYPLFPNRKDEPSPLHGDAFQQAWECIKQTESSVSFRLETRETPPFHYVAEVDYTLEGAALKVTLTVTNLSETCLPYGVGLHPWFLQDDDTWLQTTVQEFIVSDDAGLPIETLPIAKRPEWDFSNAENLPTAGLDHCFTGWSQQAILGWPSRDLKLEITTDGNLPCCHIYSPGKQSPFFCFEPVSHPVNAHHWPDRSLQGLTQLVQGESLRVCCNFAPSKI